MTPTPLPKAHRHPIFKALYIFDSAVACGCLFTMLAIGILQIILRNVLKTGIAGADELVRHLTLLLVFTGAGLAAQADGHIRIDVIPRLLPEKAKLIINGLVYLFAALVCGSLAYVAAGFVYEEASRHAVLPGFGIPVWLFQAIIPIGYGTLCFRFLTQGVLNLFGYGADKE